MPASVSTGTDHVCAGLGSGAVACWGDGGLFRLGYTATDTCPGASAGPIMCQTTPVTVPGVAAVAVASGHEHTCALGSDMTVYCWGSNDQGQAGAVASTQEPITNIANISGVTAIAAGRHHNCALIGSSGIIGCWGSSTNLELGSMTGDHFSAIVVPLPRPARSVVAHAMGRTTCALLDDGTASCWGANDFGQLGRGTMTTRELPAPFVVPCD
jgi:alpha-tubulin suppressor-like RCC1 family protein